MDQGEASQSGGSTSQGRSDAAASSSQWSRVRATITSSAALRANTQLDRETRKRNRRELQRHALASGDDGSAGPSTGRVDDEGMGDEALLGAAKRKTSGPRPAPKTRGRPLSGVERWEPLAHLLEGEQRRSRSSSRRQQQQQQQRGEIDVIAPSHSGLSEQPSRRVGMVPEASASSIQIVDEPQSTLDESLDNIPYGQDPLEYADDKHLLDSDSDSDTDSEDDDPDEGSAGKAKDADEQNKGANMLSNLSWPHLSPLTKGVSKCVAAYFLASLFTYSSTLSNFLAHLLPNHDPSSLVPFSNLHMIATVAVYFHPARSFGSMIEADIFAAFALSYSLLLSLSSMIVAEWLHDAGHSSLSNAISVVFFVGGGMAMVGWAKVKVGKPTFNTACSLIYVSTFTVVVKEGSTHLGRFETDKVWQVALVVLTGTLLSNLVCFLLWPRSATTSLLSDTSLTLDAYATLLKVLTRTFLLDDVADVSHVGSTRLNAAIHAHHTAFTSLQKNLSEAKYEAGFDGRIRGRTEVLEEVVGCLQRLGQHLGGLRSSCGLQHEIIARRRRQRGVEEGGEAVPGDATPQGDEPGGSFTRFLDAIGPHMRSLVFSCARSLHVLETSVQTTSSAKNSSSSSSSSTLFDDLEQDLNTALRRFQHEQTIATKRVDTIEPQEGSSSAAGDEVAQSSATATQDEAVLVVFFFLFSLEELTQELLALVRAMRRFKQNDEENQVSSWWGRRRRHHHLPRTLQQRILNLFSLQTPTSNSFPAHTRHMEDTAQTPLASTRSQRFSRSLWHIGQFLRQRDVKYAIKAGAGAALLACPAFIHSTRPTFKEYQGQWALVSFMVVISPTVGQSNQMSLHRLVGTVFGALVAVSIYALFRDDRLILPLLGALFSIPCFRYIVGQPHLASSGRFVLLTFNLTCLYAFNLRKTDVEAEHIGFQRTVAVAVGVVWATLLNHVLWPNEARRELAVGLSDLLFKMAWMYQYIVTSISEGPTPAPPPVAREHGGSGQDVLESQPLIASSTAAAQDPLQQMDLFLRFRLLTLESLLAQTRHEPRLKGPFPVQTYKEVLTCCTKILDKLHAMRCVTRRSEWATSVARDWIEPVNPLRREMAGNVLLFFFLLGSSLDLKTPLPPYLPPAERCRAELLSAVRSLPVVQRRAVRGSVEFLLFYSYCLAMRDVIKQLEELGRLEQKTFGVVGGTRERFERPFAVRDGARDGGGAA